MTMEQSSKFRVLLGTIDRRRFAASTEQGEPPIPLSYAEFSIKICRGEESAKKVHYCVLSTGCQHSRIASLQGLWLQAPSTSRNMHCPDFAVHWAFDSDAGQQTRGAHDAVSKSRALFRKKGWQQSHLEDDHREERLVGHLAPDLPRLHCQLCVMLQATSPAGVPAGNFASQ